jgi:hypothetical protein
MNFTPSQAALDRARKGASLRATKKGESIMNIRTLAACLLVLIPLAPAAAQQQPSAEDDILNRVISVPNPRAYRVDGTQNGARSQVRNDSTVQGGKALRVQVPARNEQAWTTEDVGP